MKNLTGIRFAVKSIQHNFRIRSKGMSPESKIESQETLNLRMGAAALFESIKKEIAPVIEKAQEDYERLFGKKHENQENEHGEQWVYDLKKYRGINYRMHSPE